MRAVAATAGCLAVLAIACGCGSASGGSGDAAGTAGVDGTAGGGPGAADGLDATATATDGAAVGGGDASDAAAVEDTEAEPQCREDADCGAGEVCSCRLECVEPVGIPCAGDVNGKSGDFCDPCTGTCAPQRALCEPCSVDAECEGQGSACLDLVSGGRVCGLGCLSDFGCADGFRCVGIGALASKQCVPVSGSCEQPRGCTADGDCAFPLVCNADTEVCAPGCPDDDACAQGLVCQAGHCAEPCDDAARPCPEGQSCEGGHCVVPGGCVSAADCAEPETYCDLDALMCVPGCQADFDCKQSAKVCEGGACVDKGCAGNFACGFGQICSKSTGACEAAQGPYCAACDPQDDTTCEAEDPGNLCVTFQDEEGAELGSFCLVACGPDPNNPCPQGYACEAIEVEGAQRLLCARACPVPPVGAP